MKIHEYQAKKILKNYNIPIQDGYIIDNILDAKKTIKDVQNDFNTKDVIVKAQIHAGGRGKGGGVKYCDNFNSALKHTKNILGMHLITHQTGPNGKKVNKVYITKSFDISNEYYVAITLDRSKKMDVFMVSTEGGVNIEEVAQNNPEKIIKVWIDPLNNLSNEQAIKLSKGLGFKESLIKQSIEIFKNMYLCYKNMDCTILEINPLIITKNSKIVALDAKLNFDNNALFRHEDIIEMRDTSEEDSTELEANQYNLNYIKLEGNVGCMVNGAGLAMATMDIIKLYGEEPANFLDVGGGASKEKVSAALKLILSDKNVKGILINIFGGIMRCDVLAQGVVDAAREVNLSIPLVVRLAGTNVKLGREILKKSNLKIISADNLSDAAKKIIEATK